MNLKGRKNERGVLFSDLSKLFFLLLIRLTGEWTLKGIVGDKLVQWLCGICGGKKKSPVGSECPLFWEKCPPLEGKRMTDGWKKWPMWAVFDVSCDIERRATFVFASLWLSTSGFFCLTQKTFTKFHFNFPLIILDVLHRKSKQVLSLSFSVFLSLFFFYMGKDLHPRTWGQKFSFVFEIKSILIYLLVE